MGDMNILVSTDRVERSLSVFLTRGGSTKALQRMVVLCRVPTLAWDAADVVTPKLEDAVVQVESRWKTELTEVLQRQPRKAKLRFREHLETKKSRTRFTGGGLKPRRSPCNRVSRKWHPAACAHRECRMGVLSRADLPSRKPGRCGRSPPRYGGSITHDRDFEGSPNSRSVLDGLKALFVPGKVRLTLFQGVVTTPQAAGSESADGGLADLKALAATLQQEIEVECLVREIPAGAPAAQLAILEVAKELNVDAIASATHGHSALRHVVAGSVALGVLKDATVPVILVRSVPPVAL